MIRWITLVILSILTLSVGAQTGIDSLEEELVEFSRPVVHRTQMPHSIMLSTGDLVFKICTNHKGVIKSAEYILSETTITNKKALKEALEYVKEMGYEAIPANHVIECGKYIISIANFKNTFSNPIKARVPKIREPNR